MLLSGQWAARTSCSATAAISASVRWIAWLIRSRGPSAPMSVRTPMGSSARCSGRSRTRELSMTPRSWATAQWARLWSWTARAACVATWKEPSGTGSTSSFFTFLTSTASGAGGNIAYVNLTPVSARART